MKILIIHNHYSKFSGEEAVVEAQIKLLQESGHTVSTYFRKSVEIETMPLGKLRSFCSAFYNPRSVKEIKRLLVSEQPDLVHIHNLFPLISPAILPVIKKAGIPIVMTVHNYRLVCPNGLFFSQGKICEACAGKGKEWNCIAKNCESSHFKSMGYALRNWWARKQKYYLKHVDAFACLTEFQKEKLASNGFAAEKLFVIPNMYSGKVQKEKKIASGNTKKYIAFAGRISPEKGIDVLFEAARLLPHIPFKLAGGVREDYELPVKPTNVELVGMLKADELNEFYQAASLYVLSSIWYEGFPMVFPEAMNHSLPIIAPNMAGFPEVVRNQVNGLLFETGNASDLAKQIESLWSDPQKAKEFGEVGYQKLQEKYTPQQYSLNLQHLYQQVLTTSAQAQTKTNLF
ncbi:glycosyltransferase family 4 protein [Labilibaculum sp.]|uniref:glycosyltransferase family 4 protein n=1 Tax=Labilibaculum sp. TaxID=2060723 RepID=UPI00356425E2